MALVLRRKLGARLVLAAPSSLYDTPSDALLSDDQLFRFALWRRWGPGKLLVFVMVNPSIADAKVDDPTIRRCIGFARAFGYDGILIVNQYAYRSASPSNLIAAVQREEEMRHTMNALAVSSALGYAAREDSKIVCAWGATVRRDIPLVFTVDQIKRLMPRGSVVALKVLEDGTVGHPLYLPRNSPMILL